MLPVMLTDAFKDADIGIVIRYRTDASVFNLRNLKVKTKVKFDTINEFLFSTPSVNSSLLMTVPSMLPLKLTYNAASTHTHSLSLFGFAISTKKTEVMHQPAPGKRYSEPNIYINGQRLNRFTYLASTLSRTVVIDDEENTKLAKVNAAFDRLRKNVWDRRGT